MTRETALNILETKDPFNRQSVLRAVEALQCKFYPRFNWYQKAILVHKINDYKCHVHGSNWSPAKTAEFLDYSVSHVYLLLRMFDACVALPGLERIKSIQKANAISKMEPEDAKRALKKLLGENKTTFVNQMGE